MSEIEHRLIDRLKQLPGVQDPYLSKRSEFRSSLRSKTSLDLRRQDGETLVVSVLDVSDSGIGLFCRQSLESTERIELRMAYLDDNQFEPFRVQRSTSTVGGYKIGVVPC